MMSLAVTLAVTGQGPLAIAVAAALGDTGWIVGTPDTVQADRLIIVADGDLAAMLAKVRQSRAGAVVVLIDPAVARIDAHVMLAAIEPLAIEIAPMRRVSAVQVGQGAIAGDVAAAAGFLLNAVSITGQIVRIDSRGAPNG
jgi:hypothetical protein